MNTWAKLRSQTPQSHITKLQTLWGSFSGLTFWPFAKHHGPWLWGHPATRKTCRIFHPIESSLCLLRISNCGLFCWKGACFIEIGKHLLCFWYFFVTPNAVWLTVILCETYGYRDIHRINFGILFFKTATYADLRTQHRWVPRAVATTRRTALGLWDHLMTSPMEYLPFWK